MNVVKFLTNKISKDFIKFSFGYFVCAILSLVITAIINKSLDEYSLGKYSYTKSFFDLVTTIASLSLYSAYLRFNVKGPNLRLEKYIKKVLLIIVIGLFIFFVFTTSIYASLYVFVILFNERTYYLRSIFRTNDLNKLRIGASILTLFLIYILICQNKIDAYLFLMCYGIGYLLFVFFYRNNNDLIYSEDRISKSQIFKYCIPGALLTIIDWLYVFYSQHIIQGLYGFAELAPYSISQRAMLSLKLFTGLYLMFYPPLYFKELEKKNYAFIKLSRLLIVLSLVIVGIICIIYSKYIYMLLGASEYLSSMYYFRILVIGELFKVLASLYSLFLTYKIKTYLTLFIMSIGSIINIVIISICTKIYGIIAVCYASLLSFLIVFILTIFISYLNEMKYFNVKINNGHN